MIRAAFLLATRNAHKAREIGQVLGGEYHLITLREFPGAPEVVEDGATFAANASKKASALAEWLSADQDRAGTSLPVAPGAPFFVLADDSGLEVDALEGAPGVHSARFAALDSGAAGNSSDAANNAKLLRLLAEVPPARRTARFRCVLALSPLTKSGMSQARADKVVLFEGICAGHISFQPSGAGGFGYDPLFVPDGCNASFAELGDAVKNSISHRAKALQKLREYLSAMIISS